MQKAEKPQIIPADHRGTMFGTGRTVSVSAQIPENVAVGQNKLTDAYNYATDESVSRKTEYDVPLYQLTHKENDGIKKRKSIKLD